MAKLKPVLFNTGMVRAIEAGRKTETRRPIKRDKHGYLIKPYEPGDVLYVRETWHFWPCNDCGNEREACDHAIVYKGEEGCFSYMAEWEDPKLSGVFKWKPSIHMPKEAARLFLRVKEVRAEYIQDITVDGILKEGVDVDPPPICKKEGFTQKQIATLSAMSEEKREAYFAELARHTYMGWCAYRDDLFREFVRVWNAVYSADNQKLNRWVANPDVWVICFERCERPKP